jgi:hypothetical protein
VQRPDAPASPLTVALTHRGTAFTTTAANVSIPASSTYSYFRLIGTSAGTDTLVASASSPFHNPVSALTVVGQGRVDPLGNWPTGSMRVGDSVQVTLYVRDPSQNLRNVLATTTWTLAPNANIQFTSGVTAITSIQIPADGQSVPFYLKAISAGTGSATISATNYQSYTNSVTVVP